MYAKCAAKSLKGIEEIPWKKSPNDPMVLRKVPIGKSGKENIEEQHLFEKNLSKQSKESETVQPHITKILQELMSHYKELKNIPIDCHTTPTVGTRKPDIVHYRAHQTQCTFNIIALGDVKGRRNQALFTDDEKGHILDMVHELALHQPFRTTFPFYLTDSMYIQFFFVTFAREVSADDYFNLMS
jgi:hypothetical protein